METWNLFPAVLGIIITYRYDRMREVLGKGGKIGENSLKYFQIEFKACSKPILEMF